MLIKSLTLNNFRQFTDSQTITFSTDKDKKVTFIMAESGVGKTTLIQSFQWILYGTCKYNKILNESVKNDMLPSRSAVVSGTLLINHGNIDYSITRKQTYYKANTQVRSEDSILEINYTGHDGISKQERGRDAKLIIKKIMQQDLFPYFFLEGESLTKVGEQMARGKSGSNSEFVKAIKGLLGFNFLYEEKKHLNSIVAEYNSKIATSTLNSTLSNVINDIAKQQENITACAERKSHIDTEISDYQSKRDALMDKLMEIGEIESDQRKAKNLTLTLPSQLGSIYRKEKNILDKFSSSVFYLIAGSMLDDAKEVMKNSDSMDKGIPGMNVDAINYMLKNHQCICGEKLVEGSEHWKLLNDLLNYLPPNNIGFELKTFSNEMNQIKSQAQLFDVDFLNLRKDLKDAVDDYDSKVDELRELNEKIGGVSEDVGVLKRREQEYNDKIRDLSFEKRKKDEQIANCNCRIRELEKQKAVLQEQDERTKKLQAYSIEADYLRGRIERYVAKREDEKRIQLSDSINAIFKDFYQENITFKVDRDYGVHIQTFDQELSDDFTSGGQDVAVALAFIGAIIKISSEKETKEEDAMDETDEEKEPYPLVMDAPTSNFGMKQMKSFSEIMPKITDQIIVFINDKDGPILKNLLATDIGSIWSLRKEQGDSYHTIILKGVE